VADQKAPPLEMTVEYRAELLVEQGTQRFQQFGAVLNGHLEGRRFLVGDRLTLADFSVAPILVMAGAGGLEVPSFRHVASGLGRLDELDAWRKTAPPPLPV